MKTGSLWKKPGWLTHRIFDRDLQMITHGTILIEKGTALPPAFRLENESWPSAWMSFKSTRTAHQLETELATTGWTFFYMAGLITGTAFGFDGQKRTHAALQRLIATVRGQKCNCIEIDKVSTHTLFGMPFTKISGHSCHIQEGTLFAGHFAGHFAGKVPPLNGHAKAAA
jgi:hypothetical protein